VTTSRRDLLALLASTAAAGWPGAVWGQQERVRRVGVLMGQAPNDQVYQAALATCIKLLHQSGWTEDRVRFDIRWAAASTENIGKYATELVALAPDVILVTGSASVGPLVRATRTIPIIFTVVPDPVGAGYVDSLARPGRNVTGFTNFEYGMGAKWLELLKEIAPNLKRTGVLRDASLPAGMAQFGAIQAVAPSIGVEVIPIDVTDAPEIERRLGLFGRSSEGGLIVTQSALALLHRDLIVRLEAEHKLPAIHINRVWAAAGGLVSYGSDPIEDFRRAAGYVDRILRGEKPADLPVQAPTKFELVINLKTARAIGLNIPPTLLARADEVIE